MKEIVKHYKNDDITVTWKPAQCIHSAICFRGLIDVFDPRKRPWITLEGGTTDQIVKQIDQCPSGALSYTYHEQKLPEVIVEASKVKIEVIHNGPLMVEGNCDIKSAEGETTRTGKTFFCRCGQSANKPFCDGSHKKTDFVD